jgi:hypothetical protein
MNPTNRAGRPFALLPIGLAFLEWETGQVDDLTKAMLAASIEIDAALKK